jgi:hypothetical protein
VRILALEVPGVELDGWSTSPLFLGDGSLRPRPPAARPAQGLADADVAALPGLWSRYRGRDRAAAWREFDRAEAHDVPVIVWIDGDQPVDLAHPNVVLFEQGAVADRLPAVRAVHGWPVLIHDHLAARFGGDVAPHPLGPRPVVGFCGQAATTAPAAARRLAATARAHLRRATGRTDRQPPPWRSHLALRRRALATLDSDPRIETDVVVRDRYRAGLQDFAARAQRADPTAREFFDNIRRTAYTVCVRGGGNFSTRLYETLCLGRIPIIVDTGLVLPWAGVVDWSELAVVVSADQLSTLPERVAEHHGAHDDASFAAAQHRARRLWEDRLSAEGFFGHFEEHFR